MGTIYTPYAADISLDHLGHIVLSGLVGGSSLECVWHLHINLMRPVQSMKREARGALTGRVPTLGPVGHWGEGDAKWWRVVDVGTSRGEAEQDDGEQQQRIEARWPHRS